MQTEKASMNELKRQIVETGEKMVAWGLVTRTGGNISARVPGTDVIVITPSGFAKGELKIEDIIVMNLDGKILEGVHKPSIENAMHVAIYRNRRDINAIIHTHSPMATSVGIAGKEIPTVITDVANNIGHSIPLAGFACHGSMELGEEVVKALKKANAAMMQNHGVVAAGPNLSAALKNALIVEEAATLFIFAKLIGDVNLIPPTEVEKGQRIRKMWNALKDVKDLQKEWWDKLLNERT